MSQSKKILTALLLLNITSCGEIPRHENDRPESVFCTNVRMTVCREAGPGIYFLDDAIPNAEGCGFSTEGSVDRTLCQGDTGFSDLIAGLKDYDGKKISVTGTFGDWRADPVLGCAVPLPIPGEPTLADSYLPGVGGFGIERETIRMLAAFSPDDARQMDTAVFDGIPKEASVTLHGVFKYQTEQPQCSSTSVVHPSGKIVLNLMEK